MFIPCFCAYNMWVPCNCTITYENTYAYISITSTVLVLNGYFMCLMLLWKRKCWFTLIHVYVVCKYTGHAGVLTHKLLSSGSMFSHTNTHGLVEVSFDFQPFSNTKPNWNYCHAHTHSLSLKIGWQTFVWCAHSLFYCLSSVCWCSIYSHFEQADIGVVCLRSVDILFIRTTVTLTSPHVQDSSTH